MNKGKPKKEVYCSQKVKGRPHFEGGSVKDLLFKKFLGIFHSVFTNIHKIHYQTTKSYFV